LRSLNIPADIIFLNRREADYLSGYALKSDDDYRRLSSVLKSSIVVTLSENGALAVNSGSVTKVPAAELNRNQQGNFLGAGDALMSLVIHYYLQGIALSDALSLAMQDFPEHVFSENCSLEETGLIEKRMTVVDHMAKFDGMTNLHNRRTGEMLLEAEISRVQRQSEDSFSIMLFDIDKFKSVNDTWGHDVGDQVIKQVARGLKDCIRPHDIGVRWGGEEFICILPGANAKEGCMIAERLRAYIEATIHDPRVITISIGVATYKPGLSVKALVEQADKALYAAKESGRNLVVLSDAL
jgi:diguanylate cyclase (GGDEF)-like protein